MEINNSKFITTLTPDPTWDYYTIWHCLQLTKTSLETAIKLLSETESQDDNTDMSVIGFLQDCEATLSSAIEKLNA